MPGAASSVRRQWLGEFCQGRPEDRHSPAILILLHMNQDFANVRKGLLKIAGPETIVRGPECALSRRTLRCLSLRL